MRQFYWKMRQLLHYYKMRQLLQNATFIINRDSTAIINYQYVSKFRTLSRETDNFKG